MCQLGRLDIVQELWREEWLPELHALKREDTCHPLLNAVHHLRPDVVEWLCEQVCAKRAPVSQTAALAGPHPCPLPLPSPLLLQGLSPFRPGTVHPYTGDGMVVTELQGISPMALIDKLSFLHPRRSKRRQLIEEVKEVLMRSVAKRGAAPAAQPVSPTVPEGPLLAASVPGLHPCVCVCVSPVLLSLLSHVCAVMLVGLCSSHSSACVYVSLSQSSLQM